MNKDNKSGKTIIELNELEKVTGGTSSNTPKKEPKPISHDTQKNI